MPLGQFAGLDGRAAGDRLQLGPVRQVVVDHHEQPFQLGREVQHRRQDDHDRARLLAGGDGGVERLHDLDVTEEPVQVPEDEKGGTIGCGQGSGRTNGRQGVLGRGRCGFGAGSTDHGQPTIDVPGGERPALGPAKRGDLGDRVIMFVALNPEPAERGAHQFGQTLGERHEQVSFGW